MGDLSGEVTSVLIGVGIVFALPLVIGVYSWWIQLIYNLFHKEEEDV